MLSRFDKNAHLLAETIDKALSCNKIEVVTRVCTFLSKYNYPVIMVRHPRTGKIVSILTTDCIFVTEDMVRYLDAMRCLVERSMYGP